VGNELVEQVDDVVVVDEGVGERDEGPRLTACSRAGWLTTTPSLGVWAWI
jgi:hypothetical protein